MQYGKILGSSVSSEQLSLTIKGLLGGMSTLLIFFAKQKGVEISDGEVQNIINAVGDVVIYAGTLFSAASFLIGLIRKLYYKVKNK